MRNGDPVAVPTAVTGGEDVCIDAPDIAAVFAVSPLTQALFDSEGRCAAASPEFTRRAAAAADKDGRLNPDFLAAAEVRAVKLEGRRYQLITLSDPPRSDPAPAPAPVEPPREPARIDAEATLAQVLRAMLDAIPAAINAKDRDGRYLFLNAYQAELWGVSAASALGRTVSDIRGSQSAEGVERERRVLAAGVPEPFFEEQHVGADGVARDWLITKLPLRHPALSETIGVVTFALDISDRKRLEAALMSTKRSVEAASQAKTLFLAQISHELRTPLNAIIGFTEMMSQEIFGPLGAAQYRGYAHDVLKAARHLLGIITDMLDVTRLDAGALALDIAPVQPGDVVAEAARMVAHAASTKRVALRQFVEPGLPTLKADARRLRQALINLISNAVKFTPEGGSVSFGARSGEGGGVELYVEDSGVGMTPDEVEIALLVFGRVREGYAKAQEGTGIGLPLAKALIERNGGRFVIESEPGRGTKIRAVFPPTCNIREKSDAA